MGQTNTHGIKGAAQARHHHYYRHPVAAGTRHCPHRAGSIPNGRPYPPVHPLRQPGRPHQVAVAAPTVQTALPSWISGGTSHGAIGD